MAQHRLLICGLPGSGKTTLAEDVKQLLEDAWFRVDHFNADTVRKEANDWDFSPEGRKRQAQRMRDLSWNSTADVAIMDFVAPTTEIRDIVRPCDMVWMNTIEKGRFEDTNTIFERPVAFGRQPTYTISEWSQLHAPVITNWYIQRRTFNPSRPTTQLLGRFQPWHAGHRALFKRALEKTRQVAIMVRGIPYDPDTNPFVFEDVRMNIEADLKPLYNGLYQIVQVPNITHITYGRDVGYTIQQEVLDADIEAISATQIRKQSKG